MIIVSQSVEEILSLSARKFSEEDIEKLEKAYRLAVYAHEGKYRESGEPFVTHPVEVCKILAQMNVDIETLIAALLHDVVEDSDGKVKLEDIEKEFGKQIVRIVDGVTKVSRLNAPVGASDSRLKLETIQKMLFAMAEDIRVIFVKLADRLHNMRTIEYVKDESKKAYKALETLEIYAPIAHKLGIYSIKWELEDLSFKVLHREEYNMIKSLVAEKKKEREQRIKEYIETLKAALLEHDIVATVEGRFKHYYSIWQKLKEKGKDFSEIYDLFGVRAIVEDIPTCYTVLGIVHSIWKPLPGRIKDYIAAPKSNGYRSLHTTVITGYGEPLEVQIRDKQMHAEAEYGLIAHWIYKEGINVKVMQKWVTQLLEWRKELAKDLAGVEDLKKELQMDEVFVFTPKGEIKHLPVGATPIDFAYAVHTDIGHRFAGAKVNGKLVPINYQLQNGDIVEIIVNKSGPRPSLDWLKYAKSPRTKAKIRKFFREQLRNELIDRGKEVVRKVARRLSRSIEEILESDVVKKYLQGQGISEEEFFCRIGEGTITFGDLLNLLKPFSEKQKEKIQKKPKNTSLLSEIEVSGVKNIELRLAKCCSPIPGDEIVAIASRRGMSVHKVNCPNLKGVPVERIFSATWNTATQRYYEATLIVELRDKSLIGKIIQSLENIGVIIEKAEFQTTRWNYSIATIRVHVKNLAHFEEARKIISQLEGVVNVERG